MSEGRFLKFTLNGEPLEIHDKAEDSTTKPCPYNVDPLKLLIYIVKLGFTRVNIIFLISAQKHRLWVLYSLEPPRRGGSNEYPHSMFSAEI